MRKKILYRGRFYDIKGEITSKILHFEGIHMKLAEALILRADAQKLLEQLKHKLVRKSKVQEGELSSEDPQELLYDLQRTHEWTCLADSINKLFIPLC